MGPLSPIRMMFINEKSGKAREKAIIEGIQKKQKKAVEGGVF